MPLAPPTLRRFSILVLFTGLAAAGCAPTGFKITPVPTDRSLEETVVLDEKGWAPAKVLLIDVDGIIMNSRGMLLFSDGENPVSLFVEKLDRAAEDPAVKAVILRINSPGGSVTASDLMHAELLHFKQRTGNKRPVIAVMMDVTASGGYYLACAADEIVAHPTTVTGSIGVIMQMFNFSGTMTKIGASSEAIKSGKMKDAGSPFRKMTDEERTLFQSLVNQFYDRFVKVVAAGRPKLAESRIREIADGRVWSAQEALELGLIDKIGSLRDAIGEIKGRIGAKTTRVVTYQRPLGWKPNVYAETPAAPPQMNLINVQLPNAWQFPEPQFMYLWAPGT